MDLKLEYFKIFQYHLNSYCIIQKPYLSFDFGVNHQFDSTNFKFKTLVYQQQKRGEWDKFFSFKTTNYKYPTAYISIMPFNYSFDYFNDDYYMQFSSNKYSIFCRFIEDNIIKYGMTYNINPVPSIIGCFNKNDHTFLSAKICQKYCSLFYKVNCYDEAYLYLGLKMIKNRSFFENFDVIYIGSKEPINGALYSAGCAISDDYKVSLSKIKNNHRFTYIFRGLKLVRINGIFKIAQSHYFQYKYANERKQKIGFFYDFSGKTIHLRGSILLFEYFKIKSKIKFNGKFFNPSIGISFNFI